MNDHIPDPTKMISDTPRMTSALLDAPNAGFAKIWQVGCDIERELNAANSIIRQQQLLDEENFRLQERINRLEEDLNELRSDEARLLNLNGELERRIKLLEEAGDAMVSHAKALGMDGTGLVKRWFKAKEAKS
jgi:hypothetical protein